MIGPLSLMDIVRLAEQAVPAPARRARTTADTSDSCQSTLTQVGGPLAPGADPGAGAAAEFDPPLAAAAPNFPAPEWAGAVGVIRHQVGGTWRMELHCEQGGRMMIVQLPLQVAVKLGQRIWALAAVVPGEPIESADDGDGATRL